MTTDPAVESARSAADLYTYAVVAERRLLAMLPAAGHPDRPVVEGTLAAVGRVARRAYDRYRRRVLDLLEGGYVLQASDIVNDVHDRTIAARTPIAITISEGD